MRTKPFIIVAVLCVFGFLPREAQVANPQTVIMYNFGTDVPPEFNIVELHGDLATSVGPNAIEAGANNSSVYLHFNHNFGDMSISIYNAAGNLVYSTVVNTAVQETVVIPILGTASGTYTVSLSNANGYAEGSFNRTYSM